MSSFCAHHNRPADNGEGRIINRNCVSKTSGQRSCMSISRVSPDFSFPQTLKIKNKQIKSETELTASIPTKVKTHQKKTSTKIKK